VVGLGWPACGGQRLSGLHPLQFTRKATSADVLAMNVHLGVEESLGLV
jgi:hypothetical protein